MDANQVHVAAGNAATTNRTEDKQGWLKNPFLLNATIAFIVITTLIIAYIFIPHNLFTGLVFGFGLMWAGKKVTTAPYLPAKFWGNIVRGVGVIVVLFSFYNSGLWALGEKATLDANATAMELAGKKATDSGGASWLSKGAKADHNTVNMNEWPVGEVVSKQFSINDEIFVIKNDKKLWSYLKIKDPSYETPSSIKYDYEVVYNSHTMAKYRLHPTAKQRLEELKIKTFPVNIKETDQGP